LQRDGKTNPAARRKPFRLVETLTRKDAINV
jgi:hypothetical protein